MGNFPFDCPRPPTAIAQFIRIEGNYKNKEYFGMEFYFILFFWVEGEVNKTE